jgi:hypothetical protein
MALKIEAVTHHQRTAWCCQCPCSTTLAPAPLLTWPRCVSKALLRPLRLIQIVIEGFLFRQCVQLAARLGLELADTLAGEPQRATDLREALGLPIKAKPGAQDRCLAWLEATAGPTTADT